MADIEHPEAFYLGKHYDLEQKTICDTPVFYEAHHLTTHGVVVGMTGSGKTGLCITLLEEAALHGIPSIIIDLKGDLSNLLLNFPHMRPEDFEPWIDPDEVRRKNTSVEDYAKELAQTWREGLAQWGEPLARVERLRRAADWRIYTPGSEAGLPVSVIQNFAAPAVGTDRETLNDRVEATATALLGLTKIAADPVQSREHILIANLLLNAWLSGRDLDLPRLISEVTTPPIRTIGTFDIDMFYPEDQRLQLALALNNLLASPSFSGWITGEPLNLASMLYGPDNKPRQLIFYLAHLDDSQRMFFLTLLLEEVLIWTRTQPGTSSLRAILYFDEVFGYLPPYPANPPTKRPLMTLLKQARAFGVGILLATQNPVDLDYKALSNAGTWFVGKLQTDRDKARLIEGLQGVSAEQGTLADGSYLDAAISSLGNQVFLLNDVHADKPITFHTRWSLSYLYGPMTRDHIATVMKPLKVQAPEPGSVSIAVLPALTCPKCQTPAPAQARFCMQCGTALPAIVTTNGSGGGINGLAVPGGVPVALPFATSAVPPVLPPGLVQFFLPVTTAAAPSGSTGEAILAPQIVFEPRLLGFAEITFSDRRHKLEYRHAYRLLTTPPDAVHPEPWFRAEEVSENLAITPTHPAALWADVPETVNAPKKLKGLERDFIEFLYKNATRTIYYNRHLGLLSKSAEDRANFEQRCLEGAALAAQEELSKPPVKRSPADSSVSGQNGAAESAAQADSRPEPTARSPKENQRIQKRWQQRALDIKEMRLTPRKADIRVTHFGVAWAPFSWESGTATAEVQPAYERQEIPAESWRSVMSAVEEVGGSEEGVGVPPCAIV